MLFRPVCRTMAFIVGIRKTETGVFGGSNGSVEQAGV
jgi:hypothetical protein